MFIVTFCFEEQFQQTETRKKCWNVLDSSVGLEYKNNLRPYQSSKTYTTEVFFARN